MARGKSLAQRTFMPSGFSIFFFNDTATTEIYTVPYTLSLHDALPISVVVVTPDRVLWLKGYGRRDVAAGTPVTPDTVFPLASCSKAFTTALAAMLADDGKLAWD